MTDSVASTSASDSLTGTVSSVLTAPPPLKYGDLAELGLVHATPAGFFQKVMEVVQVSTGLPWWSVIVLTAVATRAFLVPLLLRNISNSARFASFQSKVMELMVAAEEVRQRGDTAEVQMRGLQVYGLMKRSGSDWLEGVRGLVAISVQLGLFLGLRAMLVLPVEQLKAGGFWHWMDLTASDPYFITPVLTAVLINVQLAVRSSFFPPCLSTRY